MPRASFVANAAFRNAATMSERNNIDPLNENVDFCRRCYDRMNKHTFMVEFVPAEVKPEWVEFDEDGDGDEHPDYGGEDYICRKCRRTLTDADN